MVALRQTEMPVEHRRALKRARRLDDAGEIDQALEAWRTVLAYFPSKTAIHDRVDSLSRPLADRPSRRFLLLGSCQVYGIGMCLRRLRPGDAVTSHSWSNPPSDLDPAAFDLIFFQPPGAKGRKLFPRMPDSAIPIPRFHFGGFHPDYFHTPTVAKGARDISLPGDHSVLIMAAFRAGVPRAHVADLFNAYVFAQLGYFDEFDNARSFAVRMAAPLGFDVAPLMVPEGPPFMHNPPHPKISHLWQAARMLCEHVDLETEQGEALPPDPYLDLGSWPLYPEIARRIGGDGSRRFAPGVTEPEIGLEDFVDRCWEVYEQADPAIFDHPRVTKVAATLRAI